MSALRRAAAAAAVVTVLSGCAQASGPSTAELRAPDGVSAEELEAAEAQTPQEVPAGEEHSEPLEQPTEVPEGGNGVVPRRTTADVPVESLLGSDVLGYSWSLGPDSTKATGYDVSLCGAEPGAAGGQRSRSFSEAETGATVSQQVRVYDEATAATVVDQLRAALKQCTTATVNGTGFTAAEDSDPRLGDESLQVLLRGSDGSVQTWLVVRLHEAVSATLVDAGSGDRVGTLATIGDLVISALCAATEHGCES